TTAATSTGTGIGPTLPVPTATRASGTRPRDRPPVSHRETPSTRNSVPRVARMAGTLRKATMRPLRSPIARVTPITDARPRPSEPDAVPAKYTMSNDAVVMTPPTDRSRPRPMITISCPRATMARKAASRTTLILGPNGAGKTTLFNVIGGTIKPRSGRIEIPGHDVTGRSPRVIRRHGLARAFQTPSVFPTLTVRENLWLGRLYSDPVRWNPFASAHREAAASEITELAERIGLADVLDRPADELSHADQKVLDIGVALAGKPSILLLDEPTQGVS